MKKNGLLLTLLSFIFLFLLCTTAKAQYNNMVSRARINKYLSPHAPNFTTFTLSYKSPDQKWMLNNKGYGNHPDAGFIPKDIPASNAIEIIAKRTRNSSYFIDGDTASKFYIIKASDDINYQKNGEWLTIDKRLMPNGKNGFEASHQLEPVGFDILKKASYIKTFHGILYFNNWQLMGKNNGTGKVLAVADWENLSAGDDGIKITDIFPGIDAQMIVNKGSVKTSFIVKENRFPGYAQLILSDQFQSASEGQLLFSDEQDKNEERQSDINFLVGDQAIVHIEKAFMYAKKDPSATYTPLNYKITGNNLSILVDAIDLNHQLVNGDVIIDPLVSSMDSIPVANITGSMGNCSAPPLSCNYDLLMQTPPKATFTRISMQFGYYAHSPARLRDGYWTVALGSCLDEYFTINSSFPDSIKNKSGIVTTGGTWADISELLPCLPPPACVPQNVTFILGFLNSFCDHSITGCSDKYVSAYEPFQVLIEGRTLEMNTLTPPATVCYGSPTTLAATGIYGVPPYNYSWDNGAGNGSPLSITPLSTATYTVTVTDQCNNMVDSSVLITVNQNVTPTIVINASATTICAGTPVNFTATTTFGGTAPVYQWQLNGNNVGTNSNAYSNNNLSNNDTVTCILTSNYTCVTSPTANSNKIGITVNPKETPTITINTSAASICSGTPVNFTATTTFGGTAPVYQWQLNGNNVGTNSNAYSNNNLSNNDTVTCILTSNYICVTTATASSNKIGITVNPIVTPTITISTSGTSVCAGTPVNFTATTTFGGTAPVYQWQLNGNNTGTNSNVYSDNNLSNNDTVTCILTSNYTCVTTSTAGSNKIGITIVPAPIATLNNKGTSCTGNDTLLLTSLNTPVNSISKISWYKGDTLVYTSIPQTVSDSAITVASNVSAFGFSVDNSGDVYIGDSSGSSIQKWIPGPTTGITVAGGNGIGSAANQLNGPIVVVLDSHGDLFISDANNHRVQEWLPGATAGITVAGGNGAGSAANQLTNPVSLAIDAAGNLYVSDATNNRVQKWAPGAIAGVTVAGGNGIGSAANQLHGQQGIALDAHGNLFVADDQNYRVQEWLPGASSGITVAGGSFGSANNQFDTEQGIYVDDSDDVYIADSHALRITEWKPGATTGIPIIVANALHGPTGLYYPMDVVVTTNYIYVSDLGNSRVQRYALHAGLDTNYIPSVAGNYSAVVTNSTGCTGTTDTLSVRPAIFPSISIQASADTICIGTPVNFTASTTFGGTTPIYQWQLNGNNTGTNSNVYSNNNLSNNDTVTCILTSSYLCATTVSSNKIGITVNPIVTPTVTINASATTICTGTPVIFTAVATYGGSTPVYQWKLNGNDIGTNSNTYTNNNLVNGDEVSCTLTSSSTCVTSPVATSDTITMNVIRAAAPSVTITAFPNPICAGDTVIFNTTTANAGLSPSYQWQVNGNNTGNTNPVYITNQLTEGDSVSCTITVNQTGCYQNDEVASNKIGVTINPIPVITFNPATLTVAKGDSIQINASINDNNATYLWVPTTGLTNTSILDPFVSPIVNTTYKLFATSNGCTDSNAIVINVYAKIYIPNVFSPNGDVPHDTWVIENLDEYPEADVTVFNRWGQLIFEETDGYKQKWDGTYNGKPLPVGAYYYIIQTTPNAKPIAGCISIIR